MASGLCASAPAMALRKSATSATVRAMGPAVDSGDQLCASLTTRPGVGRKPTTLHHAAGLRSDPPVSLPSAIGTMPQARATAAPPLLPPQLLPTSYGLRVAPKTGLKVCEPAPNSGVLVVPSVTAPAARMRVTMDASFVGTWSRKNGEPRVVRIPAVSTRSLCATGRPCSAPTGRPRAIASSAFAASAMARSATRVTMALTLGFTRSICARCACMSSRAETFRPRSSATSWVAGRKQRSAALAGGDGRGAKGDAGAGGAAPSAMEVVGRIVPPSAVAPSRRLNSRRDMVSWSASE